MGEERALKELIQDILVLQKNKYAKMTFEQEKILLARLFYSGFYGKTDVRFLQEACEKFEKVLEEEAKRLQALPQEILDTVDDLKKMRMGFMSEETKRLLQRYIESDV